MQPVFYGFLCLARGKVISVTVLSLSTRRVRCGRSFRVARCAAAFLVLTAALVLTASAHAQVAPPVIRIEPVEASIRAGQDAQFRLVASHAASQSYSVKVQVIGRRGGSASLGSAWWTIPRGRTEAVRAVSTTRDDAGSVTAEVLTGNGYTVAASPGNEAVVEVGEVSERPTIRIRAEAAEITEGEGVVLTVTADPAPLSDLPVSLRIDAQGDYGVSGHVARLTIPKDRAAVTHTVRTVDDSVDEPHGTVSAQLSCQRSACTIDFANDNAQVTVQDNDGSGPEVRVRFHARLGFGSLGRITEGEQEVFLVQTADGTHLPRANGGGVNFRITATGGDFGAMAGNFRDTAGRWEIGPAGFTGRAGLGDGGWAVRIFTTNDAVVQRMSGLVTLTLLPGTGYQLPSDPSRARASFSIADDDGPPRQPHYVRLGGTEEGGSRLTVRWDEVPEATGYDVRWGVAAEPARQTARVRAAEFTTPALSPGVAHAFEVSACNDAGCSEPSPEVQGSVEQEPPADWDSPNFRAVDGSPPLIRWDAYPDATGYTAEFSAPINWTGRKDNGYAEMYNAGPEYTMRAKAHGDGWESEWTDWFNTCRPPYVHQGGPGDPPDCAEPTTTSNETPPEADAGPDIEGKRGEEDIVLAGSGTAHAEGSQTLSYGWRFADASHAELVTMVTLLSGTDTAQATFTVPRRRNMNDRSALDDGNWIDFELTVTDGDGETASDTARLTINGTTWQPTSVTFDAPNESGFTLAGPMAMGEPVTNLIEGETYELTVTAATAVDAETEIAIRRDAAMSDADEGDYDVASVMIAAGATSGSTTLTIREDGAPDAGSGDPEMLVLYGMVDGMQTNSVAFMLWDMAVPALPLIAQLVLAGLLAAGGLRRYRRR